MNMCEWILCCLVVDDQANYLDEITEKFGVDIEDEEEMVDLIKLNAEGYEQRAYHGALGNLIANSLYSKVIDRAIDELGLDEDKFDYYANGSCDTFLTYDNERVRSWKELEELSEQNHSDDETDD